MNQNNHDYLERYPDLKRLQEYQSYLKNISESSNEKNQNSSEGITNEEFYEYLRTYRDILQIGFSNIKLREKIGIYHQYFKHGGNYESLLKDMNRFADINTEEGQKDFQLYCYMLNYAQQNFNSSNNRKQAGISKIKTSGTLGSKFYGSDDKAAFTSVCMLALLTFLFETFFLVLGFLLFH